MNDEPRDPKPITALMTVMMAILFGLAMVVMLFIVLFTAFWVATGITGPMERTFLMFIALAMSGAVFASVSGIMWSEWDKASSGDIVTDVESSFRVIRRIIRRMRHTP